ncbi:Qat anti-phage system TatD family nuclease QatD [uncultured Limimaricola sp.]|uniref:Qat anti-phage system TatD family nuclease QatD n=1 Tax=uncultured Limimaricola sp. TaxID=2211667 RepID=UPI0030FA0EFB
MSGKEGTAPVDFHCHLDLCPDMRGAFDRCEAVRCITLAVTTTPKAFRRNQAMAGSNRYVHAALGLHPQLVAERADELTLFEEAAPSTRFIGEVGLDAGRRFYPSFALQTQVFERAMTLCARLGDKVISLHSVRTAKQVLDIVERTGVHRTCTPILHWFTGSKSEIRRAIDLGCYFSVNEQMLKTLRGRSLLETVPLARLLTETDAPFQSGADGPKAPGDIEGAVSMIAESHQIRAEYIKASVRATAKALVGE